jgi:hypothetical protein
VQLHAFADAVVILNACSLSLVRVLAFWEVFPGTRHTNRHLNCISVDDRMKLVRQVFIVRYCRSEGEQIVASVDNQIAVWCLSGVQNDTWRVHSSLSLPADNVVTTLDCKSGKFHILVFS